MKQLITLIDIIYIYTFYFILGVVVSKPINIISTYDPTSNFNGPILILQVSTIGIMTYFARNLFMNIPFILDGYYNFDHKNLREVQGAWAFTMSYVACQTHLQSRMRHMLG